jgi:hypothetical protein
LVFENEKISASLDSAGSLLMNSAGFPVCGRTQLFVIPRRAARWGISLLPHLNQREIPHFVHHEKINHFFRRVFRLSDFCIVGRTTNATG